MSLRVKPGGKVCVVVPAAARGNVRENAEMFVLKNLDWLEANVGKMEKLAPAAGETLSEYLRKNPKIFIGDTAKTVEISIAPTRAFFVLRENSDVLPIGVRADFAESDLASAMRKIAATTLPPRVSELAEKCGVSVKKISIRNQRSRWGSCTVGGALSINWRLVLLPPELRDHVILHELAHRIHMNHSDDFWDLLYRLDPQTRAHDSALTKTWSKIMVLLPQ